jgi:hypothetical protein
MLRHCWRAPSDYVWKNEMVLTSHCHEMSCLGIFPLAVNLAYCFVAMVVLKQTLRMASIRLPRRSGGLIAKIDFVSRLSAGFSSQIKLHPRSPDRATGFGAPLPSRRFRAAFKRPPPSPLQPKGQPPFVCSDVPSTAPFVAPFVVDMSLIARF